jgi:hypothetical protein
MITTVGPLAPSGIAAGVSVEGPMASVSVRFSSARVADVADADTAGCALSAGLGSETWGTVRPSDVVVGCAGVAAVAGAVADDGRVRISTGLDDRAPVLLPGREAGPVV